jgi:hypothetical protein
VTLTVAIIVALWRSLMDDRGRLCMILVFVKFSYLDIYILRGLRK